MRIVQSDPSRPEGCQARAVSPLSSLSETGNRGATGVGRFHAHLHGLGGSLAQALSNDLSSDRAGSALRADQLRFLGRLHDPAGATTAISAAIGVGVPRVSTDLIFGLPDQTPDDARAQLLSAEAREPSAAAMAQPCEFARWPAVPTKVLIGRDDRLFPAEFQRRVAEDRLGLDADEIPGGHLVALSNPSGLAALLVAYAAQL